MAHALGATEQFLLILSTALEKKMGVEKEETEKIDHIIDRFA